MFLLVTSSHRLGRIQADLTRSHCETNDLAASHHWIQTRKSVTDRSSGFVIAVVDDDQRILASLQDLLESADYAVRPFTSATALLESGCLTETDCMLTDIDMPLMNGLELIRVVHAALPRLPILILTGHPDMLSRLPTVGSGDFRIFKKPFDGHELLTAVSEALPNPHPRTSGQ
jgi:FixJ family two-component response regulator